MTWFVVIVLGALVLGFAFVADEWHRRAEFWEQRYFDLIDDEVLVLDDEGLTPVDTEWRA